MRPRILIVPGLYEGPSNFEPLGQRLGFTYVHVNNIPSTGITSKDQPKMTIMDDDTAFIQQEMRRFIDEAGQDEVVAILHSGSGFLGATTMQGLTVKLRKGAGKPGGTSS